MKYYYLNPEKELQGPYSKEEMLSFLQTGLITGANLAAAAGDSNWKTVAELIDQEETRCSTWNNEIGNCPYCGVRLTGPYVPEKCPDCGRGLQGHTKGLWYAFIYALKNFFNWKGRATRTEFWGFYLFYYVFYQVSNLIGNALIPAEINTQLAVAGESGNLSTVGEAFSAYFQNATVQATMGIQIIFTLVLLLPFLSVSVRRLHDTGRTAFPVIFGLFSYFALLGSTVWFVYLVMFSGKGMLLSSEGVITSDFAFATLSLFVNLLIFGVLSIYLFIMMILPSHKGANKYGPSTIYPKG